MALPLTLTDLTSLQSETTAVNSINTNNAAIETAVQDTLSRSGAAPNQMLSSLDMNSNRILNLPEPGSLHEPLRLADLTGINVGLSSVPVSAAMTPVVNAATVSIARSLLGVTAQGTASAKDVTNNAKPLVVSVGTALTNGQSAGLAGLDSSGSIVRVGPNILESSNDASFKTNSWPQFYQGWAFGCYSGNLLYVNPGTMADANGTNIMSQNASLLALSCNVTQHGINTSYVPDPSLGWSTIQGGLLEASAPANPSPLSFYLARRVSDNALALVASSYADYVLASAALTSINPGWTIVRAFRFSVLYKLANGPNWNGLPQFFQDIDNSRVYLSGFDTSTSNYKLHPGSLTGVGEINVRPFVTDACRDIWVHYQVGNTGFGAGTAYISSVGTIPLGQTNTIGDNQYGNIWLKTASDGGVKYNVTGGAFLNLWIMGYKFSDIV